MLMISTIINYMGTWPMWMQGIIILGIFGLVVGFIIAIIYKIIKADKIKAGPVEIDVILRLFLLLNLFFPGSFFTPCFICPR